LNMVLTLPSANPPLAHRVAINFIWHAFLP